MIEYINNNNLTYDEWLAARFNSIGASEVGPIVWGSKYTSNVEIFYQKVTGIKPSISNLRTYIGHKSENICDTLWPFFDGSNKDSIIINAAKGNYLKKCENRNVTVKNSKWPHLTATPDRFSLPYGIYEKGSGAVIEYKNTSTHVLRSYTENIPPDNVMQVCTQVKTSERGYAELFYFVDNNYTILYQKESKAFNSNWQLILDVTTPFWANVLEGRKIYNEMYEAKRTFNMRLAAKLEIDLAQLEPPVQNTTGYLNFLTQKYKDRVANVGMIKGTQTELLIAQKHKELGKKIQKLELQRQDMEISLKMFMKDATIMDFGANGQVTLIANINNNRIFKNNIK